MNLTKLPEHLPVPIDDGCSDHLLGQNLPAVIMPSTKGTDVNLSKLTGRKVIFIYPMTGRPDVELPEGWNLIPGARGCTPQSCGFRDMHSQFIELDTEIFGLSAQLTEYQQEAKERLHLPFHLLSDSGLELEKHLRLPTFKVENMVLYKRITLVIEDAKIIKVFYPVFPPDRNAENVLDFLRNNN